MNRHNKSTGHHKKNTSNEIVKQIAKSLPNFRIEVSDSRIADRQVPIVTTGVYRIIRKSVELLSLHSSMGLNTPEAFEEAVYNCMVVTADQILTKIAIAQRKHGVLRFEDKAMWDRSFNYSGFWANFQPVVDFIDCIGMFQRDSIKYVPTLREGIFCDVTRVSDVLAFDVDQNLNWILNDVEEKHIPEAKLLLNEFRGEPKNLLTIPELDAAKTYLSQFFSQVKSMSCNFISYKIDFEARGSPCQLAGCDLPLEKESRGFSSWSMYKLTGDELLVGSLFGFGRKILGKNSSIHDRDLAVVDVFKCNKIFNIAYDCFILNPSSGPVQLLFHNDSSSDED